VYGKWGANKEKGFIVLVDENGGVIQGMSSFESGTPFNAWVCIEIAEDGTFYAIDTAKRLLILNNFAIKSATQLNYSVKIRKCYLLPNTAQAYNGIIKGIKKSPIEAIYLIYGNTTAAASSPFITKFKIDIMEGNEWSDYTYTNTNRTSKVKDLFVSDWENLYFQLGSVDYESDYIYTEYSISSDTTTMTRIDKINPIVGMAVSAALFAVFYSVSAHSLLFGLIKLPEALYKTNYLMPLGFYNSSFVSADYFAILPWLFMFLFGAFLGKYAKGGAFPSWTYKKRCKPLAFIGRNSLWFYLAHQPIIYGILFIIGIIIN
jgi:hypothetical protein